MTLTEILQNFSLPLVPTLLRLSLIAAVVLGLYFIRNKTRDEQENILCAAVLGMWVLWHGAVAIAAVLCYLIGGEPLPYNWFRDVYHTSFFVFGALSVLVAVLCAVPYLWRTRRKDAFLLLLGGLLLWSCICTLKAGKPETQWVGTSYSLDGLQSYFFYGSVMLCAARIQKGRLWLLRLFALAANCQAVLILLQWYVPSAVMSFAVSERAGTFFNRNHVAYYLAMSITTLAGLYLYDKGTKRRVAYLLSFGLQYYALLINDTLGSLLAVWFGTAVIYVLYCVRGGCKWQDFLPLAVIPIITVADSSVIALNYTQLKGGLDAITEDPDSMEAARAGTNRFGLWRITIDLIGQKPLFGWGPEGCDGLFISVEDTNRPHNEYLQYAAFLGIPGLCLYLGGLITLCVRRFKALKSLDIATVIAGGAVIGYLISAFFGVTRYQTVTLFFLLLGLTAGEPEAEKETVICSTQAPE